MKKPKPLPAGLIAVRDRFRVAPNPPGLENIIGRNRLYLRGLAKLLYLLAADKPGRRFFVGCESLALLIGGHSKSACNRWLHALERIGVIERTWTGGLCAHDADGFPYSGGVPVKSRGAVRKLTPRASEYVFRALPSSPVDPAKVVLTRA